MRLQVLIGGRPIEEEASTSSAPTPTTASEVAADGEEAAQPSNLSETQLALATERRRSEKLEMRVRALMAKVQELTKELGPCWVPSRRFSIQQGPTT